MPSATLSQCLYHLVQSSSLHVLLYSQKDRRHFIKVHEMWQDSCNQRFLYLGTIDIWGQSVAGGCPEHCRMFVASLASRHSMPGAQPKTSPSSHCQMCLVKRDWEWKSPLVETLWYKFRSGSKNRVTRTKTKNI